MEKRGFSWMLGKGDGGVMCRMLLKERKEELEDEEEEGAGYSEMLNERDDGNRCKRMLMGRSVKGRGKGQSCIVYRDSRDYERREEDGMAQGAWWQKQGIAWDMERVKGVEQKAEKVVEPWIANRRVERLTEMEQGKEGGIHKVFEDVEEKEMQYKSAGDLWERICYS